MTIKRVEFCFSFFWGVFGNKGEREDQTRGKEMIINLVLRNFLKAYEGYKGLQEEDKREFVKNK